MEIKEKPKRLKIGELLVKEGYITEKQLYDAMAQQSKEKTYIPLGEVCAKLKFISKSELQSILRKYRKHIQLGELFVNMGLLSQEEIDRALEIQKIEGKKLGTILVELGYITETHLINSLSTQLGIPKITPTPGLIDPSVLGGVSKAFLLKNEVLPLFRYGDTLTVIMSDPLSEETVRLLESTYKCKIETAIAPSEDIQKVIKSIYEDIKMIETSAASKSPYKNLVIGDAAVAVESSDDNIVAIANYIISNAIQENATDIHIEPMENMLRVRYRINGVLYHKTDLPISIAKTLTSRLKALGGLDIADRRRHQDGRLGARIMNKFYDLRLSIFAAITGESLSIRILPNRGNLMEIEMLGFSPLNLNLFKNMLLVPSGIILITGPSGCGKTTTVYASLNYLNGMDKKVVTVEDPIEYTIDGVIQGQISEKTGLSYKNFVKSILRQDPDVIMVGEIRDKESADAVVETALTGHKVLTTFHTDETTGALLRMFDIGIETFLISSTVMSVMSQRLIRTLCPHCKEPYMPGDDVLSAFDSIKPMNLENYTFYAGSGCFECNNTGYSGRTSINEILLLNNDVRNAILERAPTSNIRAIARQTTGVVSMREDGFYKAIKGITTLEEVLRVVGYYESDALFPRSSEDIVALCEMER
jgi:type IV pilus assembly protein PilB